MKREPLLKRETSFIASSALVVYIRFTRIYMMDIVERARDWVDGFFQLAHDCVDGFFQLSYDYYCTHVIHDIHDIHDIRVKTDLVEGFFQLFLPALWEARQLQRGRKGR